MGLDSATVANAAALTALNPSWSLVVLALIVMVGFVIYMLNKNTVITTAISKSLESHDSMASTIKEIRATQIESNLERKKQGESIASIDDRLTVVEKDLQDIKKRYQK